jgi:integrase
MQSSSPWSSLAAHDAQTGPGPSPGAPNAKNPCAAAEKVTVKRSDDFNVLSIEQVHAVGREASSELLRQMINVAAFTGLRLGELLALRWRHVDFANRILHVQRN